MPGQAPLALYQPPKGFTLFVTSAKAEVQGDVTGLSVTSPWMPACAGMTLSVITSGRWYYAGCTAERSSRPSAARATATASRRWRSLRRRASS